MTRYRLRNGLSYCVVDGRAIFLDVSSDLYFRLSGDTERAFSAYIAGAPVSSSDIARLMDRRILENRSSEPTLPEAVVPDAAASALERPVPYGPCGIATAMEVFGTVSWTRLRLGVGTLRTILDRLAALQHRARACDSETSTDLLLRRAHAFLHARRVVPIETCCLLDSIAMAMFLARRRLRTRIVFGVTSDPFSAHCWVQSGPLVLNDTVGNVRSYTVIRVV